MRREFDLILYGATGGTGRPATAYLAAHAPKSLRWAVAGRDRSRLDALGVGVPALVADSGSTEQLDRLTSRTRLVLNMAGPFRRFGDPVVDACMRQGTHYCDISGETARIRDLIDRHHEGAASNRLRIVPFCGASSVPADIAVHLLAAELGPARVTVKAGLRLTGGRFGAGTIASIGEAVTSGDAKREANPFLLGPDDRSPEPLERDPVGIRHDTDLRAWTIFSPLGVSDTRAVRRSAVLSGRDIVFQEFIAIDRPSRGLMMLTGLTAFRAALTWAPTRSLLSRLAGSGDEPDSGSDDDAFDLQAIGATADRRRATLRIHGKGDAGNRITVLCACECALTLAMDEATLPQVFGVLTPSVAMGDALVDRLRAAGLSIELVAGDRLDSGHRAGSD